MIKAISTVRPVENECVFGCLRMLLEVSGGFSEHSQSILFSSVLTCNEFCSAEFF